MILFMLCSALRLRGTRRALRLQPLKRRVCSGVAVRRILWFCGLLSSSFFIQQLQSILHASTTDKSRALRLPHRTEPRTEPFACSIPALAQQILWCVDLCMLSAANAPQVMVLTHEDASPEEKMPYMAYRCHPMVVKEFFGRAAKREPPCPPSDCIWWWWKDPSVMGFAVIGRACLYTFLISSLVTVILGF